MRCCKNCGWLRWVTTTNTSYYCDFVGGEILGNLSDCCQEWKSAIQTNADRIRSMTDEELAEVIADGFCSTRPDKCNNFKRCIDCTLDWLKEEVSET